jgi:RNA polymerase sigma-70 factor (ECF subfamily)
MSYRLIQRPRITRDPSQHVTVLLNRAAAGHASAAAELLPIVYDELRALAAGLFRDQKPGHTLQPTALVHEAYLKLVDQNIAWTSRGQFFVVAAKAMRSILVDHARGKNRAKRGGGWNRLPLDPDADADADVAGSRDLPIEAIDAAMTRLAELDERKARLAELRFFGGLTLEQTAEVLGLSRATASEDWRMARAWLYNELKDDVG